MNAVADQLCKDVFAVKDSSDNPRLPVCESWHGIEKVNRMAGTCVKCGFRIRIGCVGMSEGDRYFPFDFPDEIKSTVESCFRRNADEADQPPGRFLKLPKKGGVTWDNIPLVLGAFLGDADERSFHVQPYKMSSALICVGRDGGQDLF